MHSDLKIEGKNRKKSGYYRARQILKLWYKITAILEHYFSLSEYTLPTD